jgi:formate dehydrogenase subunit delta
MSDEHTLSIDEKLVYMANQIADFFRAQGEEKAIPAIADHINKFWDPVMREDFLRISQNPASNIHGLVRKALPFVRVPRKPAA